ncbi:hypothetical protein GCM10009642_18590 [Nocardiopsis metallicus]
MEPLRTNAPRAARAAAQALTHDEPYDHKPYDHKPGDGSEPGGGPRFGRSGGRCSGLEGLRAPAFHLTASSPSTAPPSSLPAPLAEGRGSGPLHSGGPVPMDNETEHPVSGAAVVRVRGTAPEAGAGTCSGLVARLGSEGWRPWAGSRWAPGPGNGRDPWFEKR